jgi:hypothetical protein
VYTTVLEEKNMLKPNAIIEIENQSYERGDLIDGVPPYFRMQKDIEKFYHDNMDDIPSEAEFQGALNVIKEHAELELAPEQLQELFNLHPKVRIAVASHGPTYTEVRGQLLSMITKTILGCEYPTYGDHVDMDQFDKILKKYAALHNYKVVEVVV